MSLRPTPDAYDPLAYMTDVLTRIIIGHPNREIDQLLPWGYRVRDLKAVA
jgi:transposase